MSPKILHQFSEGMYQGDAVSDHALLIRRWLHDMGFTSNIYAINCDPALADLVQPIKEYHHDRQERFLIYHHAVGSKMAEFLETLNLPQILIYHNITPAEYYKDSDPVLSAQLEKGRMQLKLMRDRTVLALGDSQFNELELQKLGYSNTVVLPIVLDQSKYDLAINDHLAAQVRANRPVLLFVGRLAPNKKQEDLITLLHYYRRLEPEAKLILVGSLRNEEYVTWLAELAESLGLKDGAVTFTGHVSQQDMVTYYQSADLFISMSEHEGFGKPLIESMYLGLPVLAYSSTAVPSTMGKAGILFHEKNYESLAEVLDILVHDQRLRERVILHQKTRAQAFSEPNVRQLWKSLIEINIGGTLTH